MRQVDAAARAGADAQAARRARVLLDGQAISSLPTKQVARRLGLLPQTSIAPDGITVVDLVARGRHPYQRLLRQWSREDERAVRVGDGADAHRGPRGPAGRRALRRAAPARVDRDGAGAGDAAAAARRADHVPRHRPPGRGARPVREAARRGPDAGGRAARPQPCVPLRDAPDRDARRRDRRRGRAGRDRDRGAGRGRVRAEVPRRAVPRQRGADGRSPRERCCARSSSRHRWRVLLAAGLLGAHQAFEALVPVVVGATIDDAVAPGDGGALVMWVRRAGRAVRVPVDRLPRGRAGRGAGDARPPRTSCGCGSMRRVVDPRGGGEARAAARAAAERRDRRRATPPRA